MNPHNTYVMNVNKRGLIVLLYNICHYITLAASSGKRNVGLTVWRPSDCLSRRNTHRDSPGGSMRRGQLISSR